MSVSIIDKNCCACKTCEQICSVRAISIIMDKDGYEQVFVNSDKCVECGLCEKVCPILNVRKPESKDGPLLCGAALAKNDTIKEKGSSGGLFGVFAHSIIKEGGVVYGAAFDTELRLKTTRAGTIEELEPLYKSKYLLCDTGNCFSEIKADLNSGRTVLYCSTPCQIAGLQAFLRRDYKNLLCLEFACHGVGNQQQFSNSIKYLENKKGIQIKQFVFRHKKGSNASSSHYYSYGGIKNGTPYSKSGLYMFVPYYNAYCKQWISREICYDCPYASGERNADITIGDFHTIGKFLPEIDRFKGVSMFLCNSTKGLNYFKKIEDVLDVFPMEWETLIDENRFSGGGTVPKEREKLLACIRDGGMEMAVKTMLNPLNDWKRLIYYNLPQFIRKKLTGI